MARGCCPSTTRFQRAVPLPTASPQGGSLCPLPTPKPTLPSTHIPRRQAQGKPCPLPRRPITCQLAVHRPRPPATAIEANPRPPPGVAPDPPHTPAHPPPP